MTPSANPVPELTPSGAPGGIDNARCGLDLRFGLAQLWLLDEIRPRHE